MKRFHFFLLIGVAAALAACQKQNVINEPAEKDGSYVFTLKATADVITKTDFDAEGTFSWTAGDAISVLFNNGTTNKFFTLTTEGSGASADFTGTIDAGYTIGALDDGTKWAFYPAGSHTYNSASDIKFNIPAVNDFTADGYSGSANLPMYAQGDGNTFAFHYLTAGYKFTITDLDESISKIKFVVENNTTYELSSDIKLVIDGNNIYLKHDWGDPGAERSLTYICKVNSKTATVYVPWRYNKSGGFQPTITIYNADNDSKLKVISATNAAPGISEKGQVQPIRISCPGTGEEWEFESAYGISWNSITTSVAGDTGTGYDGIKTMKATADADNLYVYLEVKKDALFDDASYQYSNYSHLYIGDGSGEKKHWAWDTPYVTSFSSWMKYKNGPRYINWNAGFLGQKAMEHGDLYCYEIAIARSSYAALSGSSCTLCFEINMQYAIEEEWYGEETQIGFAPARWTEGMTVTLP